MTLTQSRRTGARSLMFLALALLPLSHFANAQDDQPTPASKPADPCTAMRNSPTETRTVYLTNVSQQHEGDDIVTAIRNMLCPSTKVYLDASQEAILIEAPQSQLTLADKIIHDLDRPVKTYRITYTLTELDASKTISTEHYSMLLGDGERSSLKEGNKVPVATGTFTPESSSSGSTQTQFTYLDIGMNFDATVSVSGDSVRLKSKVEDSSLDQPVTISGVTEPVVRQSVLEGTSILTLDKPSMLGSIDVPNSTRHMDIAVVVEQVK